jgi:hypothetical protein
MAQSTEFRGESLPQPLAREGMSGARRALRKTGRFFVRSIFWTYERGSWQYDIICAVILAFIFLTPASWFHDRPTLGLTHLRRTQGIIEIGHAKDGWHYIVDARLVDSLAPLAANDAIRQILQQRFHKPVAIKAVVTMRDQNDVILGYTVILTR